MKILIAVDDSLHSDRAVRFVARMRWPAGSRVIVATVMMPDVATPLAGADAGIPIPVEVSEELRRHARGVVARAEDELRAAGIATESRLPVGDPRDGLLRLAESEHVDLMVLGSHGRTGLAKLLLGSVSSHAVTHAPCSVLVVKEDCGPVA